MALIYTITLLSTDTFSKEKESVTYSLKSADELRLLPRNLICSAFRHAIIFIMAFTIAAAGVP
jgi:hypothetical protein